MKSIFDCVTDRRNTNSLKWDGVAGMYPDYNTQKSIPMWIADTEFPAPSFVTEAVLKKANLGIYGYEMGKSNRFDKAFYDWCERHYSYKLQPEQITFSGGTVYSISTAVQVLSEENDGIIIQPPVYPFFKKIIERNNRKCVENPLIETADGSYKVNMEGLSRLTAQDNCKLLMLCNPHNPVGKVFTKEELCEISRICSDNGVIILSDEVHSDITLFGNKHIPTASVSIEAEQNTVGFYSCAKAFNIAGLSGSVMVCANREIRDRIKTGYDANGSGGVNSFNLEAMQTIYENGDEYLNGLIDRVEKNIKLAQDYLSEHCPRVIFATPQGTYLIWLDLRKLGLDNEQLKRFMIEKVGIIPDFGCDYGTGGEGFVRLNFACTEEIVTEAMKRLSDSVEKLSSNG